MEVETASPFAIAFDAKVHKAKGPEGPKTLCNACGVKRCRQLRQLVEGGRKPAAALSKQASTTLKKVQSAPMDRFEEVHALVPSRKRSRSPVVKRPVRKAAARSASRTAEFGRTGDWPDEDDCLFVRGGAAGASLRTCSIDSLEHTSDSAEEVCWTPAQPRTSRPHTIPFSPMVASVGLECAAAVNLLSMSIRDSDLRNVAQLPLAPLCLAGTQACAQESSPEDSQALQAAPKTPPPPSHTDPISATARPSSAPARSPLPAPNTHQGNPPPPPQQAAPVRPAHWSNQPAPPPREPKTTTTADLNLVPQAHAHMNVSMAQLQEALRTLPAEHHRKMLALNGELNACAREISSADAAVAAVAKILAIKQAAATKARHGAGQAAQKMKHFLVRLREDYGWPQPRVTKKQRC